MLTAYKVTYSNGDTTCTNMAANVTLEMAQAYFIGQRFDVGIFPEEVMVTAVKVEQI